MQLKSVRDITVLKGKRVFLRVDFNVPVTSDGGVDAEGDERIRRAIPTITYLQQRKAIIILASHLGRPEGKVNPAFSLTPVARYLAKLLGQSVRQLPAVVGPTVAAAVAEAKPGDILMLENLRFEPGEEENADALVRALAELCDYYVDDAFGNAHRAHASMVGITRYCKSYAGLLVVEEVERLGGLRSAPRRPYAAIIGGVKLSSKLAVMESFLQRADHLLLGGNLANTVLKATGVAVGRSPVEESLLPTLRAMDITTAKLHLPVDVVAATSRDEVQNYTTKAVGNVNPDEYILDIGPDTVRLFGAIMRSAATVMWNGPMGKFELTPYASGTIGLVRALSQTKADVVVGGGETVTALRAYLPKSLTHYPNLYCSTGGGAMLQFLEQGTLPALEPLRK